jgi:deazaflavin-dependent oxidoreductase (nitroreductase family)
MGPYTFARYLLSTGRASLPVFRLHAIIYRLSGGRLLPTSGSRMPVLLLTTTGRKTGQPRIWPLNYHPFGESAVVVASNRGQPSFPQWYLNLTAHPQATIQRGRTRTPVTAREATPEEANRLWPILADREPLYLRYRTMTDRPFPLLILTPVNRTP